MLYGISYMGSKTAIAEDIINFLPAGKRFVDLFGGGFAISHCVLINHIYKNQLSLFGKKYESVLYNDYNPLVIDVVKRAIKGEYNYNNFKPAWISRDDFFNKKDTDGYIKYCWSFGNNGRDYMYSKKLEPYKKACHYAIVFNKWDLLKELCPEVWQAAYDSIKNIKNIKERRLKFALPIVKELKKINNWELVINNPLYKSCHWQKQKFNGTKNDLERLQNLQSLQSLERLESLQSLERLQNLQSLQSLERLESLQSLERLERLEITNLSYEQYEYQDGDIVYCDIPYENTTKYDEKFNHQKFYNWAYSQPYDVYFSSYEISDNRFVPVWQINRISTYSALNNSLIKTEYIYRRK